MGENKKAAVFRKALAWIVLALFALAFLGFFSHFGCCHEHDAPGDFCPFCEAFIRYTRLFRLAGLAGMAYLLLNKPNAASVGEFFCNLKSFSKATLVSLRVKLTD